MIQPLQADGSIPFEDTSSRTWSDRRIVVVIAICTLLVAAGVAVFVVVNGHSASTASSAPATAPAVTTPATTQDGRDLSQVSNNEMEAVVAANPDVVPMRLALVERYLSAADNETTTEARQAQLERARFHAGEAAARATADPDKARALRYLGWTTALLTDPAQGAQLIQQSLDLEPANPDALWFLATVRFQKLSDAAGAKPLLEQLLATLPPVDESQRQTVQALLDKVNAALASG